MKIVPTLVAGMLSILGRVPLRERILLGRFLGGLVGSLPHRERTIARLQLQRFLPSQVQRPSVGSVYSNLGQTALEALNLDIEKLLSSDLIELPKSTINSLKQSKTGIVALSAHLANWELLAAAMVQQGFRLTLVAREARSRRAQEIIESVRRDYGAKVIWRVDGTATKEIIRDLKNGATVAALIDQDTDVSSCEVPFFGVPVKTPHSMVKLAKRHQARLISAFIVRTSRRSTRVHIEEFDTTRSVEDILQEFHRRLEALICKYPDQWVWVHKRWRSQGGRTLSSREYISFLKSAR